MDQSQMVPLSWAKLTLGCCSFEEMCLPSLMEGPHLESISVGGFPRFASFFARCLATSHCACNSSQGNCSDILSQAGLAVTAKGQRRVECVGQR